MSVSPIVEGVETGAVPIGCLLSPITQSTTCPKVLQDGTNHMLVMRADVMYAYRMFLGREPSPEECEAWSATPGIEVHCIPRPVVFRIAREAHLEILEVREDAVMGPPSAWMSNTFVFRKSGVS